MSEENLRRQLVPPVTGCGCLTQLGWKVAHCLLACPLPRGAAPSWRGSPWAWCASSLINIPPLPTLTHLWSLTHFCSCLRNHHEFSSLKQHTLMLSQLLWVRSPGTSPLGLCPGPHKAAARVSASRIPLQSWAPLPSSLLLAQFSSFLSQDRALSSERLPAVPGHTAFPGAGSSHYSSLLLQGQGQQESLHVS